MANIFGADFQYLWTAILALALFLPVRRLIWILLVRRAERRAEIGEAEKQGLRRRAAVTAALLCFVFSVFYTATLFDGPA